MLEIRNILVGVDLSEADRLVADDLSPPNRQAIEKAIWLAGLQSSRLTFLAALDLSAQTQEIIEQDPSLQGVDATARKVLDELVARARQAGIVAESKLAFGKSWQEIIRQVTSGQHDMVIVGTRDQGAVKRLLFGSTGMKLIRYCPCPVWVTKPQVDKDTLHILVATDLSDVGRTALRGAAAMAKLEAADLHVIHALEFPLDRPLRLSHAPIVDIEEYHQQIREEAQKTLDEHLDCEEVRDLPQPPEVQITEIAAETAILQAITEHDTDLLVMGTVARSGLGGLIVGNTVERLLPEIPCSVVAIKPADFVCPINTE